MTAYEFITGKQVLWARRRGIRLGRQFRNSPDPRKRARGRELFVFELEDNLFEPLTDVARKAFEDGAGGELYAEKSGEGNMLAVHSSSAAACNLFHYWHSRGELAPILRACGLPSASGISFAFEEQFPVAEDDSRFPRAPNLDAAIRFSRGRIKVAAIECKYSEPYGREHTGLPGAYLELSDCWKMLPSLEEIARKISPDDDRYRHFHAAQVMKHVLGLAAAHPLQRFCLLYLWSDAPGYEGHRHRAELEEFADAARADGVDFRSRTYQDVILRLAKLRGDHPAYVDYVAERYL